MLIQFSVRNFKSFRDTATLSLIASGYDKTTRETENVISLPKEKFRLLRSAVVYGANASGKTKLIEALIFMKRLVRNSTDEQQGEKIAIEPFLLNTKSEFESSEFEIIFLYAGIRYRYGFEILPTHVVAEWLFRQPKDTEVEVFYREEQQFTAHERLPEFRIGRKVAKEGMVKSNALWLSAAGKWNDSISVDIQKWFQTLHILSGLNERSYMGYTLSQIKEGNMRLAINEFARLASIGLEEISVVEISLENLPNNLPNDVRERLVRELSNDDDELVEDIAKYPRYDELGNRVGYRDFSVDAHESSGTRKYIALAGPILDVLLKGQILIIDELDARLHPNLVCKLVELFNTADLNPKNAQLIFNTHDTNLLSSGLFRRDQIWFTEKDRYGASSLYSLNDYKPRKDENLENNYIQGKYGAIPYLGNFDEFNKLFPNHENEK